MKKKKVIIFILLLIIVFIVVFLIFVGLKKTITYNNVLITNVSESNVEIFFDNTTYTFKLKKTEGIKENMIADIYVQNNRIKKIVIKEEVIKGKVLSIDEDGVEIEGYEKVEFREKFKIYKTYGETSTGNINDILVGYSLAYFVPEEGKICAAIINTDIDAKNIRVLLKTNGFLELFHHVASIYCAGEYKITYSDTVEFFAGGETLSIDASSPYLQGGRVKIEPVNPSDKLIVTSIERDYGNPEYRGFIEVAKNGESLILINEVSLEEYLYSVIPSEMPVSYGIEALKAQAVCARSYAYRQLLNNAYSMYGAHVDDSVSFQVYNNSRECEESIIATDSTYEQILTFDGEVITALFFSTSAGVTSDATVWGMSGYPYIKGGLVTTDKISLDLSNENNFGDFIRNNNNMLEAGFPWYRWSVEIPNSKLESKIGGFKSMQITKRGNSGIIKELVIHTASGDVVLCNEDEIRSSFSPYGCQLTKADGNTVSTFKSLPSAFFTLEKTTSGYKFVGGGYGHGVGMSQNAAKVMADKGMAYEEILFFFYSDVDLSEI